MTALSEEGHGALRIGELAARTGKSVRALHLYEQMGLLRPLERTVGGFRLFGPEALLRVRWIENLKGLGLSLSEIRDIVRDFEDHSVGPQASALVRQRFQAWLDETRREIGRLKELERELAQAIEYLETCRECTPQRPRSYCPECDVPRENPSKPPILDGFYVDVRQLASASTRRRAPAVPVPGTDGASAAAFDPPDPPRGEDGTPEGDGVR